MNVITMHEKAPGASSFAAIQRFSPNWFAVTMGTGIVSAVIAALPAVSTFQLPMARLLWAVDVVLFVAFAVLLLAKFALFPKTVLDLLQHPVQSMFLGTIPMGLASLINGLVVFFGAGRPGVISLAYQLWVVDALLSVVIALLVPFLAFTKQAHAWERITGVLLLPLVAPEVAAATAALLAPHLSVELASQTVVIGYALWAISVPLAFVVLTLLFARLLMHKLPPREMAVSSWLTLGPIGTGALGLLTLGQAAPQAFAGTALQSVAAVARDFGTLGGLLLWAAGLWWLASAMLFTLSYIKKGGLPFNLGWWGFTFPLGVYTMATLTLGRITGLNVFQFFGICLAILLVILWAIVAARTTDGAVRGQILFPPA